MTTHKLLGAFVCTQLVLDRHTRQEIRHSRDARHSTFGGDRREPDVIQRTDDGFARDVTRTAPDGPSHTCVVDFSCDKDARKCVKQVEVGKEL